MRWTAEHADRRQQGLAAPAADDACGVELAGRSVLLFHGSPLRENEYLWSDRPSRVLARIASDEADDLFCFGHTHEAFHRIVGQAHFVACGSVGCGTEGDARARYAVVYIGDPDIAIGFRSVDYDHLSVVRDLAAAGLSVDLLRVPPAPHPHVPSRRTAARPEAQAAFDSVSYGWPDRGRRDAAADDPGQHDDRDHVRQRQVELVRDGLPGSRRAPPARRSAGGC